MGQERASTKLPKSWKYPGQALGKYPGQALGKYPGQACDSSDEFRGASSTLGWR